MGLESSSWALLVCLALLCAGAPPASAAARHLQQDALSNSNGCLETIPKCETGACATRNIMGVARWVCLRCLSNYAPVVASDQSIVQCVCPRGFYEHLPNATSCTRCPANSFCTGGDAVEQPLTRGAATQCGLQQVTRSTGARSAADCVAPAGFALASPAAAVACGRSEYAPQFNRLAKCLRCQSGLVEPAGSNLADGQRASKKAVCKLPPGKYMSQGLVRTCAQGFYREQYVSHDDPVGTRCLPCNPGITTQGAGAGFEYLCNVVIPGYGISSIHNMSGPQDVPALPLSETSGLPNATICAIGFYSLGGYCAACPGGTVTRALGATAVEECVVPPGYSLSASNTTLAVQPCPAGSFREGWLLYSDPWAASCTPCGSGISSEPRDLDENPLVVRGTLARSTAASCFIEAGMGMIAQGRNLFVGMDCPANTYGAAGKVYGLTAVPCKPCPRNMITDGLTRVNNSDVCINDDGWGYASEGASRCAPGFYSAKGSCKPCLTCPFPGRTTLDDPRAQRYVTDCLVSPGFGIVSSGSTSNGTTNATCFDAFNPDTSQLSDLDLAALTVMECPVGWWGGGLAVGSKCNACPSGSSTQAPGSRSVSDCNVCLAGHGKEPGADAGTPCPACDLGSYQPGGLTQCQACPSASYYPPVDGAGTVWVSNSTTLFKGAYGPEACVSVQTQLAPEAGQAFFAAESPMHSLLATAQAADLADCLGRCPSDRCCMAQFDVSAGVCKTAALTPASGSSTSGIRLLYKLPPSTMGSASSVGDAPAQPAGASEAAAAKTIASGYYAACNVPAGDAATWQAGTGFTLGPDARTFAKGAAVWVTTTLADAKARCDQSNVCWGFFYDAAAGACLFRGGVDALATRAFFVVPSGLDLSALQWASPPDASAGAPCTVTTAPVNGSNSTGPQLLAQPSPSPLPSPSPQPSPSPSPQPPPSPSPEPPSPSPSSQPPSPSPQPPPSPSPQPPPSPSPQPPPSPSPQPPPSPSPQPPPSPSPQPPPSPSPAPAAAGGALPVIPPNPSPSPSPSPPSLSPSPSPAWPPGAGPIINTIAGKYNDISANVILFNPYRFYPALEGEGGQATAARLFAPFDVVLDNSTGHLYFVDQGVGVIRRIDPQGRITTIAGNNTAKAYSGDGGPATRAFFNVPSSIALYQGCLYVADEFNGAIRRINLTTNIITTVAGRGVRDYGGDGGPATAAMISPAAVAIHPGTGDMFIADYRFPRIRRVDARTGIITTFAGNGSTGSGSGRNWTQGMGGPATATAIGAARGLTVDNHGNVYFACDVGSAVYKVDTNGIITTVFRLGNTSWTGDGGPASEATVWNPTDVKLDTFGNLLVADPYNRVVRRVSAATGIVTTIAGTGNKTGVPPSGDGGHPLQAAVGRGTMRVFQQGTDLWIADSGSYTVRKVTNYHLL